MFKSEQHLTQQFLTPVQRERKSIPIKLWTEKKGKTKKSTQKLVSCNTSTSPFTFWTTYWIYQFCTYCSLSNLLQKYSQCQEIHECKKRKLNSIKYQDHMHCCQSIATKNIHINTLKRHHHSHKGSQIYSTYSNVPLQMLRQTQSGLII